MPRALLRTAPTGYRRRLRWRARCATGFALLATSVGALQPLPGAGLVPVRISAGGYDEARDRYTARFGLCDGGGGTDCVVDGDTFRFAGEKYRIADIDTPETHPARCAKEAALGDAATRRLRVWLNDGAFDLTMSGRGTDRFGRKLRIVTRGGASVGDVLIGEGLARRWGGARWPWC